MRIGICILFYLLSFGSLSQNNAVNNPTITFGGITDTLVDKELLLLNVGILFSNDTTNNLTCLYAREFNFRIIKDDGSVIEIMNNTCQDRSEWSAKRIQRYNKKWQAKVSKGKQNKCWGGNKFNAKQLKSIRKMKSGETVYIDLVKTAASNCSCLGRWWSAGLKYEIK